MRANIEWDRSIFLAHASGDKPRVRDLFHALKDHGLEPWLDEEMLTGGAEWDKEIRHAISRSRFFLACLSRESVKKQGYVQRELRLALQALEEKPPNITFLIPGLLEDVELPDISVGTVSLKHYQYVRLYDQDVFDRLVADLKSELKITPETEALRARQELNTLGTIGGTILQKVDQFLQEVGVLQALGVQAYKRGDFAAAFDHFRTALLIDPRSVVAIDLALLYAEGKGIGKDPARAVQLLEEAAKAGHLRANVQLAHMYQKGLVVPQDHAMAVALLSTAVDKGYPEAMALLAMAYLAGEGVQKDQARGIALLTRAAQKGDVEAQSTLSMLYLHGGLGVTQNQDEAVKWACAAALQGDADALEYLEGIGRPVVDRFKKSEGTGA